MNQIITEVMEKQLKYDNQVILTYKIEYPRMVSSLYPIGQQEFNRCNETIAESTKMQAEGELYKQAIETYQYNKEHGYPIMVFEVYLVYKITYNDKNIVSLYMDNYTFTGGAHGSTIRKSQNWNLINGTQIPLECFYPKDPYYLISILKEINRQIQARIEKEGNIFFDNYCQLVLDTFRLESYYMVPKGIVIFFQQYDIAPYSTGIPEFLIAY